MRGRLPAPALPAKVLAGIAAVPVVALVVILQVTWLRSHRHAVPIAASPSSVPSCPKRSAHDELPFGDMLKSEMAAVTWHVSAENLGSCSAQLMMMMMGRRQQMMGLKSQVHLTDALSTWRKAFEAGSHPGMTLRAAAGMSGSSMGGRCPLPYPPPKPPFISICIRPTIVTLSRHYLTYYRYTAGIMHKCQLDTSRWLAPHRVTACRPEATRASGCRP